MVVAVSANLTVTELVLPPEPVEPEPEPVPSWPVCTAIALRAGTVADREPLETVNLCARGSLRQLFDVIQMGLGLTKIQCRWCQRSDR